MGTHPIFESDFDCLTDMADNAIPLERTLALIKPDSVDDSSEIERIIKTSGFAILAKRRVNLSPEQVSDFYAEHYGKMFFTNLVSFMSAGPVVALVLAKENAIQDWRLLMGPTNPEEAKNFIPILLGRFLEKIILEMQSMDQTVESQQHVKLDFSFHRFEMIKMKVVVQMNI